MMSSPEFFEMILVFWLPELRQTSPLTTYELREIGTRKRAVGRRFESILMLRKNMPHSG